MKKKVIVVVAVILVLAVIGTGFYFYKKSSSVVSPVTTVQPTQKPMEELSQWTDPAQFQFSYPKSLKLDPHDEDKKNYAHVELISDGNHPGNLIVWVKDTTAADLQTWLKQNKITNSIDTTLSGLPAKKYTSDKEQRQIVITTIRDGYLYQIETNFTDVEYWNKILQTVNTTFAFTQASEDTTTNSEESAPAQSSENQDVINEGEEMIE